MCDIDTDVCAYCGEECLTGREDPEHVLPAAINARLTTRAVCTPCNRWAGERIDQPWLAETFVGGARYQHRIPDRYGEILAFDPFLQGVTPEGVRIKTGRGGPVAENSQVVRDARQGTVSVTAPDQEALDKILERERRKVEAAGQRFSIGESRVVESRPLITGSGRVYPARWDRMAAKATLGLLARTQPAAWRRSVNAAYLRARMNDMTLKAKDVDVLTTEPVENVAPEPASMIVVHDFDGVTFVRVSLMGVFGLAWDLPERAPGLDLAWVSDPVDPARSALGTIHEVVAARAGAGGAQSSQ